MEHNVKIESGLKLLGRLISRPNISTLDTVLFPDGFNCKNIVEINGFCSTGKTMLVTHLIKNAILLDKYNHISIGGLNVSVVLIDMDIKFSIFKLIELIKSTLRDLQTSYYINDCDEHCIIELCLKNLIFIRCFSSDQLYYTIHCLREQITQNNRIALMFVDNIGAYYWQDIAANGLCKMDLYKNKILRMFRKYISNFNVGVIYTKPDYFESQCTVTDFPNESSLLVKINLNNVPGTNQFIADVNNEYICNYEIFSEGLKWITSC